MPKNKEFNLSEQNKRQRRAFTLSKEKVGFDKEKRTISLAFASEVRLDRGTYIEVLEVSRSAIDMSVFESEQMPLLIDHDHGKQIGRVENPDIGEDLVARASARFSKSALGQEIFDDVMDGIRTGISVGYLINSTIRDSSSEAEGKPVIRVTSWQPYEISIVSVPADISVGVGRSKETGESPEPKLIIKPKIEIKMPEQNLQSSSDANIAAERAKALQAYNDIKEIRALGTRVNLKDIAERSISEGRTFGEFQSLVIEDKMNSNERKIDLGSNPEDVKLSKKEQQEYSMIRAAKYLAGVSGVEAGFEREISAQIAKDSRRQPKGMYIPSSLAMANRTLSAGVDTALINDDYRPQNFIDVLRNKVIADKLGATVLNGLTQNVDIPKKATSGSAAWLATEGADAADTEPTFGTVSLAIKTVAARTDMTRNMMLQAEPSIEPLIRENLAAEIAQAINIAIINGTGADGQPLGILSTSGIGAPVIGTNGGAISYNALLELEREIEQDNAEGVMKYLTNSKVKFALKTTAIESGFPSKIMGARDTDILGTPTLFTNAVPSNLTKGSGTALSALILGNWSNLIIGYFGAIDLDASKEALFNSGGLRLRILLSMDQAVRHAESFAAFQDLTTV
jgi:HK97 family phage major capsid protein